MGVVVSTAKQPKTYKEMLNYLLPTRQFGAQLAVPRITEGKTLSDFGDVRAKGIHPGLDLGYSLFDPATQKITYQGGSESVNRLNVSVGAPVGGTVIRIDAETWGSVQIKAPQGFAEDRIPANQPVPQLADFLGWLASPAALVRTESWGWCLNRVGTPFSPAP